MISITKLMCESSNFGDSLRYTHGASKSLSGVAPGRGPVVSWNCTKTCNLSCTHCYADSTAERFEGELTTEEAKEMILDLKEFNAPALLISGGEPLVRDDFFELIKFASEVGLRVTISTNGTLLTEDACRRIKDSGVGYVGISLDGIGESHDAFRGHSGAFEMTLRGIRNCMAVGQKVGLRFTISRNNVDQLDDVFRLIKDEAIPRVCFYHLVYSGRGSEMAGSDLTHEETRAVMDKIIEKAVEFGPSVEILTVDNHSDGPYAYLYAMKNYPHRAERILSLLGMNGGNRSGMAFSNIDFYGNVHPDQFSWNHKLGNVRERKFSDIWSDSSIPLLGALRDRKHLLSERCQGCRWLKHCNGNFRPRAEASSGELWGDDPACYLHDFEIK